MYLSYLRLLSGIFVINLVLLFGIATAGAKFVFVSYDRHYLWLYTTLFIWYVVWPVQHHINANKTFMYNTVELQDSYILYNQNLVML